jgi:hypothetical protein
MNIKFLFAAFLVITSLTIGQTISPYPLVTLHDINFMPDTTTVWWPSPLTGDTVRVQGTVICRPLIDPVNDRRNILYFGAGLGTYIESSDHSPWTGLEIYQADSNAYATKFDFCDTAATYEFTGIVTPYGMSTELALITYPTPIPVKFISKEFKRPDPIILTLDSCFNYDGTFNVKLRKYLGMYVKFQSDSAHNIITSNLGSSGGFKIDDGNGHMIQMYPQSIYFKTGGITIRPNYIPPPNGTHLTSISGLLEAYINTWEIVPLYPDDLPVYSPLPPLIINVKRSPVIVGPKDSVNITCYIYSNGGTTHVINAALFKRVNGGPVDSLIMYKIPLPVSDSLWTVTIPKIQDSALVDFYIKAWDNNDRSFISPSNSNYRYTYLVLNRPLTIQDVRFSPFGSAMSSYNGYKVKISGVVISDTSDIPGNHTTNPPRVYIQNGSTPWSGILLGTSGSNRIQILNLKRGDNVTVEGTVVLNSSFSGTRIDTLTSITVNSHNNPLPISHIMKTVDVGTSLLGTLSAEPWNGTLVSYNNITIDSANADGSGNYGESFCRDSYGGTHTRIVWSDGGTSLNGGPSSVKVHNGDKIASITGVLGFTHSNYKLCPRNDGDLSAYIDEIKNEKLAIPTEYILNQNYPNPFNPVTTINYSIPKAGNVKLTVYNAIGSKVATILNEYKPAGYYSVQFNASNLPSGIYLYKLESGIYSMAKKFILLK